MLMYILIALAAIVVLFVVIIALRPAEFRVERSATMNAPPNVVFERVNDFRNWQAWSPWENLDPNLKRTYEGPPSGTGSMYSWVGNKQVGEGRMTIMETKPNERIRIKLEFIKPFAATSTAEVQVRPASRADKCQLVHARQEQFHVQGDWHVLQHGQDARWTVRKRTGRSEVDRRIADRALRSIPCPNETFQRLRSSPAGF